MIPVIDLFAGPGGLNEGFTQAVDRDGNPAFTTVGSFEMESTAVRTLTLRGMFHAWKRQGVVPESYYEFVRGDLTWPQFLSLPGVESAYDDAKAHVHEVELGSEKDDSDDLIRVALENVGALSGKPWALIGGPPCQAYSLAGRSRRANDETFAEDKKHFLYREYLRIIETFEPSVFVMENVKGLLSSKTEGKGMFERIKADLEGDGQYEIHSLVVDKAPSELSPTDFIIRAEQYGVPQKRHRVILLGVRRDFLPAGTKVGKLSPSDLVTVGDALFGLPRLRSGISPASKDSDSAWLDVFALASGAEAPAKVKALLRGAAKVQREESDSEAEFTKWISDPRLTDVIQHQSRSHMESDLRRYWYAATTAALTGTSPKLREFPPELLPNHRNAASVNRPFEDRFRVQVATGAATTIVSHISKDGHYYIHPDPEQMRSLTVREAARLQSFPDNYFFMGNRTQQYHQVGNAVPPLLARQIASVVERIFEANGSGPVEG